MDAQSAGIAGLVVDGGVRDAAQLERLQFPAWARAISPRGTLKNGEGSEGLPIACGGQPVQPGDIIIGDSDGVAVIPRKRAEIVLERVRQQEEKELTIRKRIENGERLFELLNLEMLIKSKFFDIDIDE